MITSPVQLFFNGNSRLTHRARCFDLLVVCRYPFVRNVAQFYASYATQNISEPSRYDLMYT